MKNIYFPDEEVTSNDLLFVCYMIERVSRRLKQPNIYTAEALGTDALRHELSVANVQHCENPIAGSNATTSSPAPTTSRTSTRSSASTSPPPSTSRKSTAG